MSKSIILNEFFSPESQAVQYFNGAYKLPDPIFRFDHNAGRYYWRVLADNSHKWYKSVTTAIYACEPPSVFLDYFKDEHGLEEANKIRDRAAEYGTFCHAQIGNYITGRYANGQKFNFPFTAYDTVLFEYCNENGQPDYATKDWKNRLYKDIMAFNQFIKDYEVEVEFTELMLYSDLLGVAGTIDLRVEMNKAKYTDKTPHDERKRIKAIIDIKTGRKGGIYQSYKLQLAMYQRLFEDFYPDETTDKLYIWSPTDWQKTPNYSLTEMKDDNIAIQIDSICLLANARLAERPSNIMLLPDAITRDSGEIQIVDVDTYLREKYPHRHFSEQTNELIKETLF